MFQICIIDDQPESRLAIHDALRQSGHEVLFFAELNDLYLHLLQAHCAIAILDTHRLPQDNATVIKTLRRIAPTIGIVGLLEGDDESQKLDLLQHGADYCIPRPGDPRELQIVVGNLLARLHRLLGTPRNAPEPEDKSAWRLINDGWSLNSPDGREIGLTIKERQILLRLFGDAGEIVSREDLVRSLGEDIYDYDYSGLDALISRLRKKIADQGLTFPLRTVRGKGFLLLPHSERTGD